MQKAHLILAGATAFLLSLTPLANAQTYPDKLVRLVAPFAPGGGADILGRVIANKLGAMWPNAVIVENRPGASGLVGGAYVAKSLPDGYNILLVPNSYAITANIQKDMPFDMRTDLSPIGMIATSPLVLVVNNSVPAKNLQELIAYAKLNPGVLNYGSAGPGTAPHLAGELLNMTAGIKTVHVPYKGSGAIIPALLGGEIQMAYVSSNSADAFLKDGKIRVLATLGSRRDPGMPNIPTVAESGLLGYEVDIWYALFAPARTPAPVIAKINGDLKHVLEAPGMKEDLMSKGFAVTYTTPEALAEVVRKDLARWKAVTEKIDLKDLN